MSGLMMMAGGVRKLFTTRDVLDNNEIFSIRETRGGDLLIGTRGGLLRLHDGAFQQVHPERPAGAQFRLRCPGGFGGPGLAGHRRRPAAARRRQICAA